MKFLSFAVPAALATAAVASPVAGANWQQWNSCLTQGKAQYLVDQFKIILGSANKTEVVEVANQVIADGYVETSDSINSLAGYPLGGPSFVGKQVYITGETFAPAVPSIQDLLVIPAFPYITWYWIFNGVGTGAQEVKGINIFTITDDCSQIKADNLEFNSVAWGIDDQQVTNTPPPQQG